MKDDKGAALDELDFPASLLIESDSVEPYVEVNESNFEGVTKEFYIE